MDCAICQNQAKRIFQKNGYWILECKACHHRFAEISTSADLSNQVYQDDYFFGGKDGYPNYLKESNILLSHGKRYGLLLKKYTNPGTVLDIGSAAGFILKGLQEAGWKGIGLEPNQTMMEYGCNQLGLHIEKGNLEQYSPSQHFDLVNMVQVVPHFYDIRKALKNAADITKPGGFWLIETWNKDSWIARCFGKYWHEYSPPSVLHWFSPASLDRLVSQYGFSKIARGSQPKYINGEHAKSLLTYKLQSSFLAWLRVGLKIIPDQLLIPYPSFDLFWVLYQKNTSTDS